MRMATQFFKSFETMRVISYNSNHNYVGFLRGPKIKLLIRSFLLIVSTSFLFILQIKSAKAHSIESSLKYINGSIIIRSSFSTGVPAKGAIVSLLDKEGIPTKNLGAMDHEGKLTLSLPNIQNGFLDLKVDYGPGHRDYLLIPISSGEILIDQVVHKKRNSKTDNNYALKVSPLLVGS